MNIPWTNEEETVLLNNPKMRISQLHKLIPNRTQSSIQQRRNKLGIFNKRRRWETNEINYLTEHYPLKEPNEMCVDLNRTWDAIKIQARKMGLFRDLDTYKTTTLGNLLDMSHESLYWIGFILADGHISATYRLIIALSGKDETHLRKLSEKINGKITNRINRSTFSTSNEYVSMVAVLSVQDKKNLKLLAEKFDIHPNKTYNPPDFTKYSLTDEQWLSLLIGFIDGDGHINKLRRSNQNINIVIKNHSSWFQNLDLFKEKLCKVAQIPSNMRTRINKQGYAVLVISNGYLIEFLTQHVVKHNLPVLERKWTKIENSRLRNSTQYDYSHIR